MKHLKHLLTALLLLCTTIASAHNFMKGGIYYNITSTTDFTVEVTYRGNDYDSFPNEYSGNVVIPESVIYIGTTYSVTSIGSSAFNHCTELTSIVIPNSVTSIGDGAFYGCTGLKEVHISDIAAWCKIDFGSSDANPLNYAKNLYLNGELITELVIPDSVTSIGSYAFYNCTGLTNIVIPNSVTSIGIGAFEDCTGLTSVEIPDSVTSIGDYAFRGCTGLTSIEIPNSVTSIGDYAFEGCTGLTSIVIPNSVTSIGEGAFYNCTGLTSVVIGNSVTSIESYAFSSCFGLTSVVIGNSVTSIGKDAFSVCSRLKTVINLSNLTFTKGSTDNGYVAYYADKVYNASDCSIVDDFIFVKPNNVNTLLYYLGNATELTLPADYKGENYVIDSAVFKNNTVITSVTIPNSVTSIGRYAFYNCTGLKEVHISDIAAWCGIDFGSADANPLYYAGNLYLNGKLLTDISIPAEVEKVKDFAFYNCKGVTNIDIVDGVKSIGNSAFYGCSNLETLYISNTIESIGDYAFAECNNIFDIKIGSKKAITASENIFSSDAYNNAYLYVPAGRRDFYAKTSPWSNFIIKEMDFTGIDDVKAENGQVEGVYYDLRGRVVESPTKGVYIIDGKKVIIK